jgi:hypothetical protein
VTEPLLVVASTNNRAVDNVTDPLSDDLPEDRLPLALRVGSRRVMASSTMASLQRTASWLENAQPSRAAYDDARKQLNEAMKAIRAVETELLEARRRAEELDAAQEKRIALQTQLDEALRSPPIEPIPEKVLKSTRRAFKTARRAIRRERFRFHDALDAKEKKNENKKKARKGRLACNAILRTIKRSLAPRLSELVIPLELPHLPEDSASNVEWDEVIDEISDALDLAKDQLEERVVQSRHVLSPEPIRRRCEKIDAKIDRLTSLVGDIEPLTIALQEEVDAREGGLFELALSAREAWAALNKDRLLTSVRKVLEALEAVPSFRTLGRSRREVLDDLLELFPVFGCTLLSLGNVFPIEPRVISKVVIDEAGQCHPAYALSAIARAEQALVIGDVNQLEPVIELNEHEESRVLRRLSLDVEASALEPFRVHRDAHPSAQAMAERAVAEVVSLREHFRCQPEIIEISNRLCHYDLRVQTAPDSLGDRCSLLKGPVLGIETRGAQTPYWGSWRNDIEVRAVVDCVRLMCRHGVEPARIAVLTPYRGQMRALEAGLKGAGVTLETGDVGGIPESLELFDEPSPRGVVVGTLHRFQGGERDVVVLSTVVSTHRSLTFTNQRVNMVNVAVSRARLHLIVVGSPSILSSGPVTKELVSSIPADGWISVDAVTALPRK